MKLWLFYKNHSLNWLLRTIFPRRKDVDTETYFFSSIHDVWVRLSPCVMSRQVWARGILVNDFIGHSFDTLLFLTVAPAIQEPMHGQT